VIAARPVYQGVSLACLGLGVFLVVQGRALGLAGPFGPGPGFFAFWIGLALAALSLAWLGQVTLRPVPAFPPGFVPERAGLLRVAAVVAALVAFAGLLTVLGFSLAMLGFLLFLLLAFGREYVLLKLAIAVAGSFGVQHVFERLLRVPLPSASLEILRRLGL
jgi:hypothetical protein